MTAETVPLSVIALDLPAPAAGWAFELERRGIPIVLDDIGRPSISRDAARDLLTEHCENEARTARQWEEIEQRAIEADQRFRASLPAGIRSDAVPEGVSAAELMMLSDPMQGARRQSVLEHALEHPAGAIVYTPINEDAS
jgi:hypothetical protein